MCITALNALLAMFLSNAKHYQTKKRLKNTYVAQACLMLARLLMRHNHAQINKQSNNSSNY